MKKILIWIFCSITLKICAQEKTVTLNYLKPESGQRITVTYTGKLAKAGTKMTCISLNYTPLNSETKVIPCKLIDNQLIGTFRLPDSASYFIIKIENKKEIDNNQGNGFCFNTYKNGKPAKGTFFTEAYYLHLKKTIFNSNVAYEDAIKLVEKEYSLNPELKTSTFFNYLQILTRIPTRRLEAIILANEKFENIIKNDSDEKLSMQYAYLIAGDNTRLLDSLKKILINKYPTGTASFTNYLEKLRQNSIQLPDSSIETYNKLLNKFAYLSPIQKRLATIEVLKSYAFKNDKRGFDKYLNQHLASDTYSDVRGFTGLQLNEIAWKMFGLKKNLQLAKYISEKSIESHLKYDTLSTSYGNALDSYAAILFELGDKKQALINQKKAVNLMNYSNVTKNQKLIEYLIANENFEEAKLYAKDFIEENLSNPKIDSLFKLASSAKASIDFDKNYTSTKKNAETEYLANLSKKLIDIEAPNFELKSMSGQIVKLIDLKGKIVILDFWATWCGPCIKSFPAMRKVIDLYKDQSVVFLFIDTFEDYKVELDRNNELAEKIKKILNDKKVNSFTILYDKLNDNYFDTVGRYDVSGIPAKFVIDKEGNIRYKSTGFSSDEVLIKELTTVINIIESEQKK